jgi:hypothetical protein
MVNALHSFIDAAVIGPQLCIGHLADLILESDRIFARATCQQNHRHHQTTQSQNHNSPNTAKADIARLGHN